jgi:hypothetical protein
MFDFDSTPYIGILVIFPLKSSWSCTELLNRGLYIGKYPPPQGGDISRCHLGGKICKGEEKRGENVKEKGKRRKGERK